MGLEAINFLFRSEEQLKNNLEKNSLFVQIDDKKYLYRNEYHYWIDLELQDVNSMSIRIALCNPLREVLHALDDLLIYLFSLDGAVLMDLTTKGKFENYNEEVRDLIFDSYARKKKVFVEIYGAYEAAISSEEFYRGIRDKGNF